MVVKIGFEQEYKPFRMTLIYEWHQHWYGTPEDSTVWMRERVVFAGMSPVVYLGNDRWGTTADGQWLESIRSAVPGVIGL